MQLEFFAGADAARERQRDGNDGPGDTYIRNTSATLLHLRVTDSAAITVNQLSHGGPTDVTWTWSQLAKVTDAQLRGASLFRVTTVGGEVAGMNQQYLP